ESLWKQLVDFLVIQPNCASGEMNTDYLYKHEKDARRGEGDRNTGSGLEHRPLRTGKRFSRYILQGLLPSIK
ncbi:MAG: hypothetical protein QGH39_11815, partial [Candidatus Thermoplasmatota archaeon]|nr:hypothetical protein [Candidatus Thermoplasmatota archaeon]